MSSVIVLAFVKSSGKKTDKSGGVSETSPLLAEQDSLEGSLRDKVVRGYPCNYCSLDVFYLLPTRSRGRVGEPASRTPTTS